MFGWSSEVGLSTTAVQRTLVTHQHRRKAGRHVRRNSLAGGKAAGGGAGAGASLEGAAARRSCVRRAELEKSKSKSRAGNGCSSSTPPRCCALVWFGLVWPRSRCPREGESSTVWGVPSSGRARHPPCDVLLSAAHRILPHSFGNYTCVRWVFRVGDLTLAKGSDNLASRR